MAYTAERLYQLLPAIYRQRDAERGEPLKALVAVLADQAAVVEADIARLYDNWFIETCAEWVVPYLGDLLGVRGLYPVSAATFSQRARVANTIGYRRRKGTATMLEQLARDTTGWPARVVEFFQKLATTQNVNHRRLHNLYAPDLRDSGRLDLLGTPFDSIARSVDVRHVDNGRGTHNIMNLGIFLWRLQAYPVFEATPSARADGSFAFSALGQDAPLFNHPRTETDIAHLAEEVDLPVAISRRALQQQPELYEGPEPSISVRVDRATGPVVMPIVTCNLEHRSESPTAETVAVDPVLGRFAFASGERPDPDRVHVTYYYGFSSELGGGAYDRGLPTLAPDLPHYVVTQSLRQAVDRWVADGSPSAVIELVSSKLYRESLALAVPAGVSLTLRAAHQQRPVIELRDPLVLTGGSNDQLGGQLTLDGLLITGHRIELGAGAPAALSLRHCTLVPGWSLQADGTPRFPERDSIATITSDPRLSIALTRTISGRLNLGGASVSATDSIVDGLPGESSEAARLAIVAGRLRIADSTVLGNVAAYELPEASNVIFEGKVVIERKQTGCVRFCYLPLDSRVPRRFRCQPDDALRAALDAIASDGRVPATLRDQLAADVGRRLAPRFVDTRYGQPGYLQLSAGAALEIRTGADDGAEMGAFKHLQQPQREANLRASLEEYLRVGLEAGLFFVT